MRLDGSVVAIVNGEGVGGEHAVGAYLVVASVGSTKGWTVDASGVVRDVAPAAVKILSTPVDCCFQPPLIIDSTKAVVVRWANNSYTAYVVNLVTGASRPLITVPQTGVMSLTALTALDVSSDRQVVWLAKITPTGGISGRVDILGIDLESGAVSVQGHANVLAGQEIAITQDGKSVAGQEEAGLNSSKLAIWHLHRLSLETKVDLDVQGKAPYVGGAASPSVLFAPDGASVAWWGGLDNGSRTFQVNVAAVGATGRTLYNPPQADFSYSLSGVLWVDPTRLVVQNGFDTYTINATTGAQTLVSHHLNWLDSVLS